MRARLRSLLALHVLLLVYSVSGVLSKLAAGHDFLSLQFILLYAGVLAILGLYAVGWQQILKRLPLTTAFSNKAITIVWGIVWGFFFFAEPINFSKLVGALLIISGVILYSHASFSKETADRHSVLEFDDPS